MIRYIEPQLEAVFSQKVKQGCLLGTVQWPSGIVRFHNGVGNVYWDEETYYGVGDAGMIDMIKEGPQPTLNLTLRSSDASLVNEALKDDAAGGEVRIYLGAMNEYQQLSALQLVYLGLVNNTPVRYASPPTIGVEALSYSHRWNQPKRFTTYSSASQRALHPDDCFFDDVEAVAKGPLSSYSGSNAVGGGGNTHTNPNRRR